MMNEFDNKIVWVVGASGALGSDIAKAFLSRGAIVALTGRDRDKLEACARLFPKDRSLIMPIDIRSAVEVDRAASAIVERYDRIDVLINSTSTSTFAPFLDLTDHQWQQIFDAKLFAYNRTMRASIPFMVKRGSGAIVNISGSGGRHPKFPAHIAGCAGNAGVNLASKAVADLFQAQGIRVNCVAPGPIRSPRFDALHQGDETATRIRKKQPDKELGEASDITEATLYLASNKAKHINGVVLTVDGGATPTI